MDWWTNKITHKIHSQTHRQKTQRHRHTDIDTYWCALSIPNRSAWTIWSDHSSFYPETLGSTRPHLGLLGLILVHQELLGPPFWLAGSSSRAHLNWLAASPPWSPQASGSPWWHGSCWSPRHPSHGMVAFHQSIRHLAGWHPIRVVAIF